MGCDRVGVLAALAATKLLGQFLGLYTKRNKRIAGAIDGKHVQMRAPANSGSLYFNYKKHFSTVLLAVADANYRVIYASVGSYGHESDAGIFDRSDFSRAMKDDANVLGIPGPIPLLGSQHLCTHFFFSAPTS